MTSTVENGVKVGEVRLNLYRWNRVVVATMIGLFTGAMLGTYILKPFYMPKAVGIFVSVVIILVSTVIHEGLHWLAARIKGVPRSELNFEVGTNMSYCHPTRPMPLSDYRFFLLFPAAVMIPLLVAVWALTLHWMAASAVAINLAGCLVDIVTWWKLRPWPADVTALVDPGQPGCDLYHHYRISTGPGEA